MIKLNRNTETEILNSDKDLTLDNFEFDFSPININFFSDSEFPKQTNNVYPFDLINPSLNLKENHINLQDIKLNNKLFLIGIDRKDNKLITIKE